MSVIIIITPILIILLPLYALVRMRNSPFSLSLICLSTLQENKDMYSNLTELLPEDEFTLLLTAAIESLQAKRVRQHELELP